MKKTVSNLWQLGCKTERPLWQWSAVWYCYQCKKSYSWCNYQVRECNQSIWFKKWMTEGYSVRQLSELSGHSPSKP